MWLIIKNEWSLISRSGVLKALGLAFMLLLFLTVYLGDKQTEVQSLQYQQSREYMRANWENNDPMHPHGAAHYGTYLFKPTNMLSSLDEGVNSVTGNVLRIEGHVQNEILFTEASQMQSISKFGKLKSSLLLQYILPLLLIFLSFQSINSEKQSKRLKLLVFQGASKKKIILGKAISVFLFGLSLLGITVLTYLILNSNSLNLDIISRTLLLFISYSIYYFTLCSATVFLSARLKNSNLALTSMMGLWILWTIFLPNILMSSVEEIHKLPTKEEFNNQMSEDRAQGIDGHNPRDERRQELKKKVLAEYNVESIDELPIDFGGIAMQADEEYGNKVWDKHFGNLRRILAQQKKTYTLAGLINPFISLQNLSMGFAGNDNLHHNEFLVQAEEYRRNFIKRLNDEHAYGKAKEGQDYLLVGRAFFESIEDFEYKPTEISSVFKSYIIDFIFLSLWCLFTLSPILLLSNKIRVE